MGNRLQGKVAIVTGGSTGIGEAISKKFAREGAKVLVAGLPDDPLEEVIAEIRDDGGEAILFSGDLSALDAARQCVRKAVNEFGRLDILINNAGVFIEMNPLEDYSEEGFDYLIRNNIKTAFTMTKAALPELQKTQGNIVTTGSESAALGLANNAPYGGTKGFLTAFVKGLAVEQAANGVRCNIVAPGPVDTAWTHKETGPMKEEGEKMIVQATPMGRRGTTEEVANVFLFLASDEASYVTGAVFPVDGGITIAKGAVGEQAHESFKKEPSGTLALKHAKEGHTTKRK